MVLKGEACCLFFEKGRVRVLRVLFQKKSYARCKVFGTRDCAIFSLVSGKLFKIHLLRLVSEAEWWQRPLPGSPGRQLALSLLPSCRSPTRWCLGSHGLVSSRVADCVCCPRWQKERQLWRDCFYRESTRGVSSRRYSRWLLAEFSAWQRYISLLNRQRHLDVQSKFTEMQHKNKGWTIT